MEPGRLGARPVRDGGMYGVTVKSLSIGVADYAEWVQTDCRARSLQPV